MFILRMRLAVCKWLLGKSVECAVSSDEGKAGVITAEDLKECRGVPVAEWAEWMLAKHVPVTDVEVTLYGGPADGWVERIAAGKPWPEMMLVKVGMEVHAYEQVSGRAVFRYVRKVGYRLGDVMKEGGPAL